MEVQRRLSLWRQVVEQAQHGPTTIEHVCAVMIAEMGVDGSSVTVLIADGARETVYSSDPRAANLAELALTLGEGPSVDGLSGYPTLIADINSVRSQQRWPMFAPAAADSGVQAIFALPMQVGGAMVGVVELHRSRPGGLTGDELRDGLILTDTACGILLDATQGKPGEPELVTLQHPEVHQATGMIIAQLGVSAAVALVRLRAYAYANDRRLRDVARDVVARRLRFYADEKDGDG
jgi:hypothetical protein